MARSKELPRLDYGELSEAHQQLVDEIRTAVRQELYRPRDHNGRPVELARSFRILNRELVQLVGKSVFARDPEGFLMQTGMSEEEAQAYLSSENQRQT